MIVRQAAKDLLAEGKAEGKAEGRVEGRAEGRAEGIIEICQEHGEEDAVIIRKLEMKMHLTEEEANGCLMEYCSKTLGSYCPRYARRYTGATCDDGSDDKRTLD